LDAGGVGLSDYWWQMVNDDVGLNPVSLPKFSFVGKILCSSLVGEFNIFLYICRTAVGSFCQEALTPRMTHCEDGDRKEKTEKDLGHCEIDILIIVEIEKSVLLRNLQFEICSYFVL